MNRREFGMSVAAAGVQVGKPPAIPRRLPGPIRSLAWDSVRRILISNETSGVRVWDPRTLKPGRRIELGTPRVQALALSPDCRRLAVAAGLPGSAGGVFILDWPSGRILMQQSVGPDAATAVAFSPDSQRVAVGSMDRLLRVWSVTSPTAASPMEFRGHSGAVLCVAHAVAEDRWLTGGFDRTVRLWDAASGAPVRSFTNHTGPVHEVVVRPDGRYTATASDDRTARVWQPAIGRMVRILRGHDGPVLTVRYSPDGSRMFTAGAEGVVRAFDADSDELQTLPGPAVATDWIYALIPDPAGGSVFVGDGSGIVRRIPV